MIRLSFRFLALVALAGAFAACVIDGARSIADDRLSFTPMGATAYWAFPNKFPLMQAFVERRISPVLWDPILLRFLMLPTWAVLGALGAALFYALRRRPPPIGHSSRRR
ncbi:MAG: hypothetical protein ABR970_18035 [Roseiarcus sp.]|jgi:hypothetical protein